jgi:hypothetical protein
VGVVEVTAAIMLVRAGFVTCKVWLLARAAMVVWLKFSATSSPFAALTNRTPYTGALTRGMDTVLALR